MHLFFDISVFAVAPKKALPKIFVVLAILFGSMNHLTFVQGSKFTLWLVDTQFFHHHLLKNAILSPTELTWHPFQKQLNIIIGVYFWILNSFPLIYMSTLCQYHTVLMIIAFFSSVTQSCSTLCDPMDCSTRGFPVHHQLLELAQTHVHRVSNAIQSSHPLSSPSLPAFNLSEHQGLF